MRTITFFGNTSAPRFALRPRIVSLGAALSVALLLCCARPAVAAPEGPRTPFSRVRGKAETWTKQHQGKIQSLRANQERLQLGAQELKGLDLTEQRKAAAAFGDLSLTPQARTKAIAAAVGPSLTEAAHTVMKCLAVASAPGQFERASKKLEHKLRPDGQLNPKLAATPWAIYLPQEMSNGGKAIDAFLANHSRPEFKAAVDRAMNVLRVATTLEQETLSRIAVHVPPENRAQAASVVSHYLSRIIALTAFPPKSEKHLRAIIDSSFRISGWAMQEPATRQSQQRMVNLELVRVLGHSKALQRKLERRAKVGSSAAELQRRDRQLAHLSSLMQRRLDPLVQTTPESKAALTALARDLQLTSRVVIGSLGIVGAIRNEKMPAEQRTALIKNSVEGMGPIFVKLLQTAMNQQGLRDALVGKNPAKDNPVLLALESLQDSVSPMPISTVRRQIREALGQNVEQLFSTFDPTPLAAGSIGQIHRATIHQGGQDKQVVVKVQRRGLAQSFDDTLHVTNLAVKLVRETMTVSDAIPHGARRTVEKVLATVENTVPDLVRSFAQEIDFSSEAQQMLRFMELSRGDQQVVVPQVYLHRSARTVLTMEYVQGEKLSTLIDRYLHATRARKERVPSTPLPAATAEAEARRRATLLAEQRLGLTPTSIACERRPRGYSVTLGFDHPLHKQLQLRIADDGRVSGLPSDQSLQPETIRALRDRLVRSFAAQNTFYRTIHGDIHEGNFMVGRGGQTLIYLDFGNMVQPNAANYRAAGNVLSGWALGKPSRLAWGLVQMSDRYQSLSHKQRQAEVKRATQFLVQTYGLKLQKTQDDSPISVALATASSCGLPLSSTMLQWMKTTISMSGNLEHFSRAKVKRFDFKGYRRIAGDLFYEWQEARKAKRRVSR